LKSKPEHYTRNGGGNKKISPKLRKTREGRAARGGRGQRAGDGWGVDRENEIRSLGEPERWGKRRLTGEQFKTNV